MLIMQTLDDEAALFRTCGFHLDAFRSGEIAMGARLPPQPMVLRRFEFTKRC
jgi:hypothetical protein